MITISRPRRTLKILFVLVSLLEAVGGSASAQSHPSMGFYLSGSLVPPGKKVPAGFPSWPDEKITTSSTRDIVLKVAYSEKSISATADNGLLDVKVSGLSSFWRPET